MKVLTVLLVLIPTLVFGYGSPSYLPDGSHPRLFLTASEMTRLQAKVSANDSDWVDLKARADVLLTYAIPAYSRSNVPANSINYAYEGMGWLEAAQTLGLAYKMTGNTSYAAKLKTLIDVINAAGATPVTAVDSGFPSRSVPYAMALMYDWLYDYLDGTTKTAMVATINSYYSSYVAGSGWYAVSGPAYDNYYGGHLIGFGSCALATYGDNATAPAMLSDIRARWANNVPAAFTTGGFKGGYPVESFNYSPNHLIRLLQFGVMNQTATGQDIYSSYPSVLAGNLFYNLKPNRWQSTDEGDMPGGPVGVLPAVYPLFLAWVTPGTDGDYMRYLYQNLATPPASDPSKDAGSAWAYNKFLFSTTRSATDYRAAKPLVYRSLGDEHVFSRSDWTDTAVWASFMAGNIQWAAHESNAAGHIALQRGTDYLLVNSGQWQGDNGIVGTPYNFNSASQWTNTLYFSDGPATQPWEYLYYGGLTGTYAGGQMQGFSDTNAVMKYETAAAYTYVKADHTNAYDIRADSRNATTRSLRYFHRNFLRLGGNVFVVYDRIKALKTSYTKKLYWHLNKQGQPVALDSSTAASTVGSSKLVIKAVYPSTAAMTLAQDVSDRGGNTTPRVEIADTAISTDFNPLTVLIADSSAASVPAMTGIDTAAMQGVVVASTVPQVALFAKDGTAQTSVTYTVSYASTGRHVLVDMAPHSYNIFRDGTQVATATASSEGVLSFTADGGGTYSVTQGATPPPPTGTTTRVFNGRFSGRLH